MYEWEKIQLVLSIQTSSFLSLSSRADHQMRLLSNNLDVNEGAFLCVSEIWFRLRRSHMNDNQSQNSELFHIYFLNIQRCENENNIQRDETFKRSLDCLTFALRFNENPICVFSSRLACFFMNSEFFMDFLEVYFRTMWRGCLFSLNVFRFVSQRKKNIIIWLDSCVGGEREENTMDTSVILRIIFMKLNNWRR
jgi:hypothetical protein